MFNFMHAFIHSFIYGMYFLCVNKIEQWHDNKADEAALTFAPTKDI